MQTSLLWNIPSSNEKGEVAALIGYLSNAMMLIYINAYHSEWWCHNIAQIHDCQLLL